MVKYLKILIIFYLLIPITVNSQQVELSVQTGHSSSVRLVRFSPDGRFLASADENNKVNVWHIATGGQMSGIYFPKELPVTAMAFSKEGNRLAVLCTSVIYIYDLINSKTIEEKQLGFQAKSICFGESQDILFVAGQKVILYNMLNQQDSLIINEPAGVIRYNHFTGMLTCLTNSGEIIVINEKSGIKGRLADKRISRYFTGKNPFIYLTRQEKFVPDYDNQSVVYIQASRFGKFSYQTGKKEFSVSSEYVDKVFTAVDVSVRYQLIIGANEDGKLYVSGNQTGKLIRKLKEHYADVYDITFSPDEELFASCSKDRSIIIWESKSLKPVKRLFSRAFPITSLNKSSDENLLVFGSETGFTRMVDINSAVIQLKSIRNHTNPVSGVSFLPGDSMVFCCANDNKVSLLKVNPVVLMKKKPFKRFVIPRYFILNSLQNLGFYVEPFCFTDTIIAEKEKVTVAGYRKRLKYSRHKDENGKVSYYQKTIHYAYEYYLPDLKKKKINLDKIPEATGVDLSDFDIRNPSFGHKAEITGAVELQKHQLLATSSLDGTIKLWDLSTKKLQVTIVPIDRDKRVLITADNYYMAPREALSAIGFKQGLQFFLPEQFDIQFNRPDLVLERIGIASDELISAYRNAYLKRLKKLNLDEHFQTTQLHLPEIEIINQNNIPLTTQSGQVVFQVRAADSLYLLDRLNVYLNNVPVYGISGIDLKSLQSKAAEKQIVLQLSSGKNKVQVSVMNEQGTESLKETFYIEYQKQELRPALYLLTIGTSEYADSRFNLNYAAKDAVDIAAFFGQAKKIFNQINIKTITNQEVTRENILNSKSFLQQAGIDDVVIIYVAGHGLLDQAFNYYYGTYNINFDNPSENGITYDELGSMLDGLKALKKMLIMDTCHSGELDKDEIEKTEEIKSEEGVIAFRSAGMGIRTKEGFGFKNVNELSNQLFADLRVGSGATVLSSSGGAELSMESRNWQNGLFTYCLLEGLSTRKADKNNDRKIMVSELQDYIKKRTDEISGGKQIPTSRSENISMDFRIW